MRPYILYFIPNNNNTILLQLTILVSNSRKTILYVNSVIFLLFDLQREYKPQFWFGTDLFCIELNKAISQ